MDELGDSEGLILELGLRELEGEIEGEIELLGLSEADGLRDAEGDTPLVANVTTAIAQCPDEDSVAVAVTPVVAATFLSSMNITRSVIPLVS